MSGPGNVKRETQRHQRVLAFLGNVTAVLGLVALGFLLTRPAMPVGWIVISVAVIRLSLAYSPTRGSMAIRRAVPVRSTDCYGYQANSPYYRPKASSKED